MGWIYVFLAGILEVFWVLGLKFADSIPMWIGVAVLIVISFWLVMNAYKTIPVGTAYAVFTGMGAAGIVLTEMLFFGEPFSIVKIALIILLIVGIVGIKRVTTAEQEGEQ